MENRNKERKVKCKDCGAETTDARIAFADVRKYKKGLFEPDIVSPMTCFVCPKCGRVELYADFPEKFA